MKIPGDIDTELTMVIAEPKVNPLPFRTNVQQVPIEEIEDAVEAAVEWNTYAGLRRLRPKTMDPKQLLEHQKVDNGALDIIQRALELRERLNALKAPKEDVKRMA